MANATIDAAPISSAPAAERPPGYWRSVAGRLRHDPVTLVCLTVLVLIVLAAVFAPWVAPHDPYKTSMLRRLAPMGTPGHLLGTDELGRDLLTRLIYGGRISLFMSFTPVCLAFLIGGMLGMIAGFVGGAVNMVIMRTTDVFYAFPSILLAIAISGALGAGLTNGLISLTLIFIPPLTRIAESVTTQVRNLPFVEAARASGASTLSIIRVHVLGNVVGPVLVYASSLLSVAIVVASGLSFLGLGVSPPEADWGLMLNTLRQSIYVAPWNAALPGAIIFVTCMCFNLVSDGLRQALDIQR